MSDRSVARRYAAAFFEIAVESDSIDALDIELARTVEELQGHEGRLFETLSSPMFTRDERRGVLDAVVPKLKLSDLTVNLLRLLLERGRFATLPDVARIYNDTVLEKAGKLRVSVATAEPLSPQLESEVRSAFEKATGKTVLLEAELDPSLIGGMVARVGGTVYDSSIRTRLQDIKHTLIQATTPAQA